MTVPKIGVFGWYMQGNFGDEIMAIMVARSLRSHGFRPVVYKLPRYLADAEGIETADTLDVLLEGASACVLGGGGLFVSAAETVTPALAVFDEELRQLAVRCASRSIPVWGVSIGGTGTGRHAKLYPGIARLLGSGVMRGVTIRLQQDRALVEAFGIPSEHYPDIVFLAPDYWPDAHVPGPRRMVVTNKIARYWVGRRLIHVLDLYGPSVFGIEPRHLRTRNVNLCSESDRHRVGRAANHVAYQTVQQYSDLMSRVQVIVSSKLHLGIFGMAYGAVFFSYGTKEKTRAQLRELGMESHNLSTRDLPRWLSRLRTGFPEELETTARLVPELRLRARGHVAALLSFLHAETGHGALPDIVFPERAAISSFALRHGDEAA